MIIDPSCRLELWRRLLRTSGCNSIVTPNCMPTGVTDGPGNNFLVGCADHDGKAFPPNEYIITYTPGNSH